jgi:sigma-B regulation protein RsbQ
MTMSSALMAHRNNVRMTGNPEGRPMVFAHGFGCDQGMWRHVAPAFEDDFRVVLFDIVGFGQSDASGYSSARYGSLHAYAADIVDICREHELEDVVFVGHSVSAMLGVLAAKQAPELFGALVMVAPSPRYIDDTGYAGGFSQEDIDGLLETMDADFIGWSAAMAPVIMGNDDRPQLGAELQASFCRSDQAIARDFAKLVFLSDNRADLADVDVPALILQCTDDAIAPLAVGEYVHAQMRDSELMVLDATGHCPNISAPAETIAAIRGFVA